MLPYRCSCLNNYLKASRFPATLAHAMSGPAGTGLSAAGLAFEGLEWTFLFRKHW